jgi:5-formyltetrahydrofolate cyclo-ligase
MGGGFYDRTLAMLRAAGPTGRPGFARGAQARRRAALEDTDAAARPHRHEPR